MRVRMAPSSTKELWGKQTSLRRWSRAQAEGVCGPQGEEIANERVSSMARGTDRWSVEWSRTSAAEERAGVLKDGDAVGSEQPERLWGVEESADRVTEGQRRVWRVQDGREPHEPEEAAALDRRPANAGSCPRARRRRPRCPQSPHRRAKRRETQLALNKRGRRQD